MSYDLKVSVKVEGSGAYDVIACPEYAHPTYNLRDIFVNCMGWDYSQRKTDDNGEYHTCYYPCDIAIENVERGVLELRTNGEAYMKYNPSNGWGSIGSALEALESLMSCIYKSSEAIPLECLYMSW